jgi:outer membrane protein TolC
MTRLNHGISWTLSSFAGRFVPSAALFSKALAGSSLLASAALMTGCHPTQPFYLGEDGDLSHYLETATELEHPDVAVAAATEATQAVSPLLVDDPDTAERWELTLEDVVQISLQNTSVVRGGSTPPTLVGSRVISPANDSLTIAVLPGSGVSFRTVYGPGIQESSPGTANDGRRIEEPQGVEAALSAFDAQFSSSLFYSNNDRPLNVVGGAGDFPQILTQNLADFNAEIRKRTAEGTELFFRNVTNYDQGNGQGANTALDSYYTTAFELGGRQPLLRGAGAQINRMPVILARIETDKELATLEGHLNNMLANIEVRYWDLYNAYRTFEETKVAYEQSLAIWNEIKTLDPASSEEAQARETVFALQTELKAAKHDLYVQETNLRWLMGIAPTDCRLILPTDTPTTAELNYDWCALQCETLVRRPEIRLEQWEIKRREMELILARNQLLPQLDAVALYRWLGRGENLFGESDVNFVAPGSSAFDALAEGDFQEFNVGLEMDFAIGFRRELAGVRYAQLSLSREKKVLEDLELDVIRELTQMVRSIEDFRTQIQTQHNRRIAAQEDVERTLELVEAERGGQTGILLRLLQAYQRHFRAAVAVQSTVTEYNKALCVLHNRKGTSLAYNGVMMGEGPWPEKAYFDALGQARKRDAGTYIDYGWTRPKVISQGSVDQTTGIDGGFLKDGAVGETIIEGEYPQDGMIYEQGPAYGQPTPAPLPGSSPTPASPFRREETLPGGDKTTMQWGGARTRTVVPASHRQPMNLTP